jgi:predicted dehydrogenase
MDRRNFLVSAVAATAATAGTLRAAEKTTVSSPKKKLTVGIVGCGRMGQYYAQVYKALPDTELVAIAEWNSDRRKVVGKRFGVTSLFKDADSMLRTVVPDIVAVITPTKFMKGAVIACAKAGVKGVSTDKPIAARLSDADEMVQVCAERNVVFAGGNLQRAKWEVQQAAQRIHSGEFGKIQGVAVHGFGGEISGGGCQHLSVLRLMTGAEVQEVTAWGNPAEALDEKADDGGLNINGLFRMTSGINCQVFGLPRAFGSTKNINGVDVWTEDAMVQWHWGVPKIFQGTDAKGVRKEIDPKYPAFPWPGVIQLAGLYKTADYLVSSIHSFIDAVNTGSKLWISGHDLRQALEIAIACKRSAQLGNRPVQLPLKDRSLTLYPRPYRWLGGDVTGRPQSDDSAAGKKDS